jgi:hypothetical protein
VSILTGFRRNGRVKGGRETGVRDKIFLDLYHMKIYTHLQFLIYFYIYCGGTMGTLRAVNASIIIAILICMVAPANAVVSPYNVDCGPPSDLGQLIEIPLTVDPPPDNCSVVEVKGYLKFYLITPWLPKFSFFAFEYTTFTPPTDSSGSTTITLPDIDESYILIPGPFPVLINVKFETDCEELDFNVFPGDSTECSDPIRTGCCQKEITTPQDTYYFCYTSYDIAGIDYQAGCPDFTTQYWCDYQAGLCNVPTAITIASFTAEPGDGAVTLNWETGDETDNLGFNLYRSESKNGLFAKINDALIFSKASNGLGAAYAYEDDDLKNGRKYFFKLEDVDIYGVKSMHGPVSVTPRLIY